MHVSVIKIHAHLHLKRKFTKMMAFVTDDAEQVPDTVKVVFTITASIVQQLRIQFRLPRDSKHVVADGFDRRQNRRVSHPVFMLHSVTCFQQKLETIIFTPEEWVSQNILRSRPTYTTENVIINYMAPSSLLAIKGLTIVSMIMRNTQYLNMKQHILRKLTDHLFYT